jgi:acetyl esterase/lipase
MSLMRPILNQWLRMVEKPKMRKAVGADPLRRNLELQAKLFFFSPFGTKQEWQVGGTSQTPVDCLKVTPPNAQEGRLLLYFHGGGFTFGSPNTHAALAAQIANRVGATAFLPKYRLAPEHPFPAATDDVRAVWDALTVQDYDPAQIAIGGDSAGGALAFGLLGALCSEKKPLPGAVFGFSPLADMEYAGQSFSQNAESDVVLAAERAGELVEMYLAGHPATDPLVSPIYADFTNAPPVWVTVGDTEILLDDSLRLADRLRQFHAPTTLQLEKDLPHVWPIMQALLPEGKRTLNDLAEWIRREQDWADDN